MPTTTTHAAPSQVETRYAFENGVEAVCELGTALSHLRSLERTQNDVLSGERATQHREAIERAILDLVVGLGIQRDVVQLGYEIRGAE